ncbi:MAG: LAGLIDADG family homing endonuclease [Candidatus Omnitrophota bacterium]|nr:LAGLIDADG family homing endonuclease [Candidatus Omnitrophota bacterium]
MEFNLYQLCEKNYNKGGIKVILSKELSDKISLSLIKLKEKKIKLKDLANNLKIDYTTLWKNLKNPKAIPLIIIRELENITNINFQEHIIYLYSSHSKSKIKIPKTLDKSISKLTGCIIADGHLKTRKSGRGKHYEVVIRDEYKTNIIAAIKWFKNIFEINLKGNKEENHYSIYVSNKIINNYFTKVLGLPEGKKTGIVSTPNCILDSNIAIKQAYLQGLFMFDGGVDYRNGYVNYISKSKKLVEEILILLKEISLEQDYYSLQPDRYERYKIRFRKKEKLKKCLILFQKNTEKWWRLYEHLYGLKGTTKDLKILIKSIDTYYPRVRYSAITFSDVIKAIESLREKANILNLSQKLNRNKTVVYEFLKKLERWEIVTSYRVGLKKYYKFNKTLKIPRRTY